MSAALPEETHLAHAQVADVAAAIRSARMAGGSCVLMVGAGCSASAGIPLASRFIELMEKRFAKRVRAAGERTYNAYMRELSESQRRELIAGFLDDARMNAAHLCMANLMQSGHVDRILTTNFDPLVIKACALLGEFPGMYDLAASPRFVSRYVMRKAVFYLHGQRAGFNWANTDEEVALQARALKPVFRDTATRRTWIVIGYSGNSDRLLEILARLDYAHGLFWVPYREDSLPQAVQQELLSRPNTFVVRGHDADTFFIALNQALGIYPPEIVERPFSHLERFLSGLPALPPGHSAGAGTNLLEERLRWASGAVEAFEVRQSEGSLLQSAQSFFASGQYEYVAALRDRYYNTARNPEIGKLISHAFRHLADGYAARARMRHGEEGDDDFRTAEHLYGQALAVMKENAEARRAWAAACARQAARKEGAAAQALLVQAAGLYRQAVEDGDTSYETRVELGNACSGAARLDPDPAAAGALWAEAARSYGAAARKNPSRTEAWFNRAVMLAARAAREPRRAARLLKEASDGYGRVLELDSQDAEALKGLADALAERGRLARDIDPGDHFADAEDAYRRALRLRPELYEARINYGVMLARRARSLHGSAASGFVRRAREQYELAEKVRPGCAQYHLAALSVT